MQRHTSGANQSINIATPAVGNQSIDFPLPRGLPFQSPSHPCKRRSLFQPSKYLSKLVALLAPPTNLEVFLAIFALPSIINDSFNILSDWLLLSTFLLKRWEVLQPLGLNKWDFSELLRKSEEKLTPWRAAEILVEFFIWFIAFYLRNCRERVTRVQQTWFCDSWERLTSLLMFLESNRKASQQMSKRLSPGLYRCK